MNCLQRIELDIYIEILLYESSNIYFENSYVNV